MRAALTLLLALASVIQSGAALRSESVEVESVNTMDGIVTFADSNDELWVIESENTSEYHVGDEFILIFSDMGTDEIYDDEAIAVMKLEVVYVQE